MTEQPSLPDEQPAEVVEPSADATLAAERLSDLQRLQAEYANYRKRVDRDRDLARTLAIASVVESLLPVLDDIHLARQHGDLESGPFVSIAEKLESTLARYGVERFGEPGTPFDPAIHDALMHVEDELAEGTDVTTVVGILQPGYRIGEKVVRPARVSVADPS
jgi:molecular chaperone GrpE